MTTPPQADHRERLQNALLAINKLQAKVAALESGRGEPIAVIGLACRFPGRANGPDAFWRLLRDGVDAVTEIPPSRFDIEEHFDADPDAPGKSYSRWGGFIEDVDRFDPHFFGISPREAVGIDPQHRLLLEAGWAAIESAGVAPTSLAGSRTGVFVGITGSDYAQLMKAAGPEQLNAYSATGSTSAFVAGRLSYVLGLQGPSVAVDTACSSSLSAVHLACQSLRGRDCELALAGGVNVMLTPDMFITTAKNRMLSTRGRCSTFDAAADGFVRGEGCGIVVLKRLSSAVADGDPILAVIRGSAMNQDGASSGITVPNKLAQEAVIRDALAAADVQPHEVHYVEAHGTGTPLGDPIELRALGAVLGQGRSADAPFYVGSVKTNIGHLEAASGIAGLIKVILMLQRGEIPPHLHIRQPSPHIPWEEIPAAVPATLVPWTAGAGSRVAGVSSFGASGTNVHVVVGEFVERGAWSVERGASSVERQNVGRGVARDGVQTPERPVQLLALSGRTRDDLRAQATNFRDYLAGDPHPPTPSPASGRGGGTHAEGGGAGSLADICHTAAVGRTHFAHRLAVLGAEPGQMVAGLDAYLSGSDVSGLVTGEVPASVRPRVAFPFPGQGAQYVGMARQLYETEPRFRQTLERCEEILRPHLDPPLLSVLYPAPGEEAEAQALLDQTAYTQPALFALEYALSELWRSWGLEPHAVLGHSVGEYVAACVAGVFSLEEGLRLIAERARLMQALPSGGAMAAAFADVETVEDAIAPEVERLGIAAVNGPANVVISGEEAALAAALQRLEAQGIRTRRLRVSH
ncbi:MAG: type I polyketide synthase, partial [Longimicrobiaceae bacterium]